MLARQRRIEQNFLAVRKLPELTLTELNRLAGRKLAILTRTTLNRLAGRNLRGENVGRN